MGCVQTVFHYSRQLQHTHILIAFGYRLTPSELGTFITRAIVYARTVRERKRMIAPDALAHVS
jgi:hypothetical protein